MLNRGPFYRKTNPVPLHIFRKTPPVLSVRQYRFSGAMGKHPLRKKGFQRFVRAFLAQVSREKRDAPRSALTRALHHGDRGVQSRREKPLPHAFGLEKPAMPQKPVKMSRALFDPGFRKKGSGYLKKAPGLK
jgi:hypothetical protein